MQWALTPVEARILGVLIEKQMSTPDYYPLTLNAVVTACNQKTNRAPVMDLDETEVSDGLDRLRQRRLVWQVKTQGSRVPKYEHNMESAAEFSERELGLLCELLLRGPQTPGELRARSSRLVEFHGLPAVEHTLRKLSTHEKGPFAVELPREPGRKERRFHHLLGDGDPTAPPAAPPVPGDDEPRPADRERIDGIERRLEAVEAALETLQKALHDSR